MVEFTFPFLLLILSLASVGGAVATVQQDWIFPQSPDNSSTVDFGKTAVFKWTSNLQNWFPQFLPNGNVSHVDVWVTGMTISKGYHKLAAGFDVKSSTSFLWSNAIIPSAELAVEDVWVLRFVAAGDDLLTGTGNQISSPLFHIKDTEESTTISATSTSTTSSAAASTTTSPTSASSTTKSVFMTATSDSTTLGSITQFSEASATSAIPVSSGISTEIGVPNSEFSHTGLSTGAKAGIGVAAGVGAACLCAILCIFLVRRRSFRDNPSSRGRAGMADAESSPKMEIQSNLSYVAYRKG